MGIEIEVEVSSHTGHSPPIIVSIFLSPQFVFSVIDAGDWVTTKAMMALHPTRLVSHFRGIAVAVAGVGALACGSIAPADDAALPADAHIVARPSDGGIPLVDSGGSDAGPPSADAGPVTIIGQRGHIGSLGGPLSSPSQRLRNHSLEQGGYTCADNFCLQGGIEP